LSCLYIMESWDRGPQHSGCHTVSLTRAWSAPWVPCAGMCGNKRVEASRLKTFVSALLTRWRTRPFRPNCDVPSDRGLLTEEQAGQSPINWPLGLLCVLPWSTTSPEASHPILSSCKCSPEFYPVWWIDSVTGQAGQQKAAAYIQRRLTNSAAGNRSRETLAVSWVAAYLVIPSLRTGQLEHKVGLTCVLLSLQLVGERGRIPALEEEIMGARSAGGPT
jgi:hypothetical protein